MSAIPKVRFLDRSTPPHIVTLVLIAGLGAMNMSAFLPSLPAMTRFFETEYGIMQLAVSLYLAATAVLQVFIGPISDRYGRRSVLLVSTGIFVVATLGCLFANTVEVFLFWRLVQAVVAAGLVLSRAIVRDMVPQNEAASMIGYVTMGMALVPMVAPMIGGALDEAFGWQSTFWFLTAAGLGVGALIWFDLGETASGEGRSFRAQFQDYPELFGSRRFWGYVFTAAFASGAFFAFLGGAPLVASDVYGLSSFWAGVGFGAPAVGYAVGNFLSGRYSVRFGINWMIRVGAWISLGGLLVASALNAVGLNGPVLFFGFCTFVGLGNGLIMPNASAGMLSVRPHLAGTASGLGSAIMIGGGAGMSVFAGISLAWGNGSLPLLLLMAITTALSVLSIHYVIAREKQVDVSEAL
ncbi:Bcr/CflA family efflux MFS transporter [Alphaproteobacteria bacterium GH1-50]|uniref:Bcr/CflA family efflux transporter n=1 Tax=Kangsaoukella pontilimi TaxID=2691042 RepID=A0A7C9MFC3_9RHOB|nr:multidrug effflux MFS transporter [Kangsaoukella pontilimi]MXQ08812.1 Bcr/CflA family efflux MFS transporter [Kangsaoukella pontilimi]